MSKLYDLLNSVVAKLKATEKSVPKKVSDLEQDVKTSWDELEGKPFGFAEAQWVPLVEEYSEADGQSITVGYPAAVIEKLESEKLKVICDGEEYEMPIAWFTPYWGYAGNGAVSNYHKDWITVENIPIFVEIYLGSSNRISLEYEDGGTHTISVYCWGRPATVIDQKLLPDSVVVEEDIQPTRATSWYFIDDKPFGDYLAWTKMGNYAITVNHGNNYGDIVTAFKNLFDGAPTGGFGKPLRLVIDGVSYTVRTRHYQQGAPFCYCAGNASIKYYSTDMSTDPTVPFFIRMTYLSNTYIEVWFADGNAHQVEVYTSDTRITQIDPKYIPDTIARTEDIPVVPEHTWESLPDKPFGEEIWESVYEDETFTHNAMIFRDKSDVITKEQVLKIVVDGVEYMTPVKYVNGIPMGYFAGNGELFVAFNSGNVSLDADEYGTLPGSPFHIRHTGGQAASILFADQSSHVVSVYESAGQSTLDPKFLPIDAITQSVIDALPTAEGGSF